MSGPIAVPTAVSGRWRPLQGAAHLIALIIGIRGLLSGPVPNEPLYIVTNNSQILTLVWYISLVLGAVAAMIGEIRQLKIPFITTTTKQIEDFVEGLLVEQAGTLLLGSVFMRYALAILLAPNVVPTRSLIYFIIGLGFIGRTFQIRRDRKKLKIELSEAHINANNT